MTSWWQHPGLRTLALLVLCLALFLPGQSTLPPFDRDEARFAQASRQMVESGDYIDIRFQDVPRHKKPIGIYWLQSASVQLTGAVDAIWAYRIPSWLGAIAAVLLTAALCARYFSAPAGVLAGLILATCLLLGVEARMAKTDAVLLACIVLAQFMLARLWQERVLSARLAAAFWLALGAGVLIKGPIILLVCGATAATLCILERSANWLKPLRPMWGVPLLLAVVAPWLIAISLKSGGEFWRESVGRDLMSKAAGVQESHGGPPGYYLGTFFVTFWPWSFLIFPAAVYAWRNRQEQNVRFLLAWIVPFWLIFEAFPTKLLHYTLPVFPAIAILFAALLTSGSFTASGWLTALGIFLLAVVALAAPLAPGFAFPDPMTLSFLSIGAGLLLVAAAVVAFALKVRRPALAGGVVLVALVNFYAAFWGQQFPNMDGFWLSRGAARLVAPQRADCPGPVTAIGYSEPSLVFYLGRDTVFANDFVTEQLRSVNHCRLLLVEQRALQTDDVTPALGVVKGFNYSRGKPAALYLFRLEAQPDQQP